jgi:asparagine synthetase B (glutamine-hydrolysing)
MCGIVGYIKLNTRQKKTISFENMEFAFNETMSRGREATGFFTPHTGVVKDGENATDFVKKFEKEIRTGLNSPVFIGHCRAATSGFKNGMSPASNNNNNHPHEGKRFVLVHNGHFSGLYPVRNYPYNGNCDSELALSYIEVFGVERGIALMPKTDNFSLVIYDKVDHKIYFYRESNPLVYGYDFATGNLLFGSTSHIVLGLVDNIKIFGLTFGDKLSPLYGTEEGHLYIAEVGKEITSKKIALPASRYDAEKNIMTEEERKQLEIPEPYSSTVTVYKGEATPSEPTYQRMERVSGSGRTHRGFERKFSVSKRLEVFTTLLNGEVLFASTITTNMRAITH